MVFYDVMAASHNFNNLTKNNCLPVIDDSLTGEIDVSSS